MNAPRRSQSIAMHVDGSITYSSSRNEEVLRCWCQVWIVMLATVFVVVIVVAIVGTIP